MDSFKELRNNLRVKRYYAIKINNGMGYLASLIDKIMFRSFISIALLIYLYIKTNNHILSLILTIIIISIYSLITYKVNRKKLNQNIRIIDKELIVEKVYSKLMSKSTDDYVDYIKDILSNYNVKDMKDIIRKDLDLVGTMNNEKVGIKCYQYSEDHKVDKNDMKNFFIEIRDKDIKKGIIITTSSFLEDARTFFDNMEGIEVEFITIKDIIEKIKDTNLYPRKKDIKKMILKQLDDNRSKVKNESRKIISKDNTKSCIITGVVIIVFSKLTNYTLYYKAFGILLITLGIIPIIKTLVNLMLSGKIEDEKL